MTNTRIRRAASAGLLVAAIAACSSGPDPAPAAPIASAPAAAAAPTVSASAPAGIPAAALLQPDDVRGATAETLPQGEYAYVRPLRPCGGRYPSDPTRTAAVAKRYVVPGRTPETVPTVVVQFIGRHQPGGAARQIQEIDAALKKCRGGLAEGQRKWDIVESDGDTMLVRIGQRFGYADEEPATVNHYAAVARVGDVVVVVADMGWENMDGSETLVRELIAKARTRAEAIR
ncbi:hypothetical protein [Actinoplanes flavus]|uniref:PknH-like extracellular domain-containing protein n=1 Tax=Actinoplanes flavus TaxID=2820290 RepID=A0ABS3UF63_9ACTN|nr:hypothetical protein [Actinoplanes flavus]MBO3737390.1 hypothetical protein [Actinoplanes flavus]